ncbi:hypothetical protein RDV63_14225 [Rheinheimera sp. MMS21-TC3]|nr:hypothetical protein [Rheinheimera sp. MMS21-TC3]WNO62062.1 hypothetical protein RDV63_14225 [Rheinheimera sp. MMS21-TC3]
MNIQKYLLILVGLFCCYTPEAYASVGSLNLTASLTGITALVIFVVA